MKNLQIKTGGTSKGFIIWLIVGVFIILTGIRLGADYQNQPGPKNPLVPPAPVISATSTTPLLHTLAPISGKVGDTVTIQGSGFLSANTVLFGGGPVNNTVASNNGTVLSFAVPNAVGADCKPNMACPMFMRLITPAVYSVAVRNANGTSNELSFTVTGSSSSVSLPTASPVSSPVTAQ